MSLPNKIEKAMENSITYLTGVLRLESIDAKTDRTLIVSGWNDDKLTIQAIAHYLVGLLACAIDAALNIRAELLDDTTEQQVEIFQNVVNIVRNSNTALTKDQKEDERNPWIAEGIWHLCIAIASRRKELHPIGTISALNASHVKAKDHGLDIAAIYERGNLFGLSLIETKAYKNKPNQAVNDAVIFFREIDKDKHAFRIRQVVNTMRKALAPKQQSKISGSFWNVNVPICRIPHYDEIHKMNWKNTRSSFREFEPNESHIVIMPHIISDFDDFFDKVADEMRYFAKSL